MNMLVNIVITCICLPWPAMIMMSPMMIAAPEFASKKSSILTAILFFMYPSIIFLLLYLLGYSFYETNPFWWFIVTLILGLLVTISYGLPRQWNNVSRGISNYGYFIKGKYVYFDGKIIKNAHPDSFTQFDNRGYYSKDKNNVYYNTKKIATADATSFRPLANDTTNNYWHDKHNAYYKWGIIPGADGASFTYVGEEYAYDAKNVFFQDKVLKEADRNTFRSLQGLVGRDDKNIFVQNKIVTNVNNPESFEIVTISDVAFGKDKTHIYALRYVLPFPMLPFPNADLDTFEVLGEYYAKDKNQVYNYSYHKSDILVLEEANPEKFMLFFDSTRGTDATDGKHYYKSGELFVE